MMYHFIRSTLRFLSFTLCVVFSFGLLSSNVLANDPEGAKHQQAGLPKSVFKALKWTELIPKDDLEALRKPPAYLKLVSDSVSSEELDKLKSEDPDAERYERALYSSQYIKELDGRPSRIPGFVVPVDFSDDQKITSFFLVPYFGACLHEPAPPPNQVIFVEYPKGLKHDNLNQAIFVLGILKTEVIEKSVAKSAYTMEMLHLEKYGR